MSVDHEEICTFCSEVQGTSELNLFFDEGITREQYILHETEHWVVFPCIGALVDWYVLIVSKRHTLSVGWLTDDERADLRSVILVVQAELRKRSGGLDVIVFEHGSLDFRNKGGSCFDHTHVHVVAATQSLDEFLAFVPDAVELAQTTDWIDRAAAMVRHEHVSYLALASETRQLIGVARNAPSQFFRRCLARWLGVPDGEWDWYINRQIERVKKMAQGLWGK